MVDVRHKTVGEVRTTIRHEIESEQRYLKAMEASKSPLTRMDEVKTKAHIAAYQQTLHWLADLES